MRRYHSDGDCRARGKHRKAYKTFVGTYPRNYDIGEGRRDNWNKRHPLDCGHTDCYVCHGSKLLDIPTARDLRENERYCEFLRDVDAA